MIPRASTRQGCCCNLQRQYGVHTGTSCAFQKLFSEVKLIRKTVDRFVCKAGQSWRVDETYVKIKGCWTYLYRAVDSAGKTVDFLLQAGCHCRESLLLPSVREPARLASRRYARWLSGLAPSAQGVPRRGDRTKLRSSKYLNNLIEQDHRSIKLRLGPMLGFKRFRRASIRIAGIELAHRIRKGQFALDKLRVRGKAAPEIGPLCSLPDPTLMPALSFAR